MKNFKFGWGMGLLTSLALASGFVLIRGSLASRERERQGVARCASQCRIGGLCTFDRTLKICQPRSSADCANSESCRSSGICSLVAGHCVATSDEECRAAEQCKEAGRCKFSGNELISCIPGNDVDCQSSSNCQRFGRCTVKDTKCNVTSNEDCARAEACVKTGQCSVRAPELKDRGVGSCAALSNDDCAKGESCKSQGSCTAIDGYCR